MIDRAAQSIADDATRLHRPTVSVVVPVYRSEGTLRTLYDRLVAVLERESSAFEIVFVEDCGGDGSWHVIENLAASDSRVHGIRFGRNYGQHNALLCGIRAARNEIVVTMDDDLQNPPEEIPKLLDRLAQGFDVVYGAPEREQHGFLRDQASQITKIALQGAMGAQTARHVSAFRAFRTSLRDAFDRYSSPFVSIDVLLTWGTTRFSHLLVRHDPRTVGVSNYTLRKLVTHAMNMMTGFTTIPLQLASLAGFAFSLFGLVILGYVILNFLVRGGAVPGFAFLASIVAIFSGVQLFALGIIGEYLARMHLRTMERPAYLVRESIGLGSTASPRSPPPSFASAASSRGAVTPR
jgi:undecaprenyl-phosphate 4-deoxy-4-formamido-L-arabinose transferase